MSNKATIRAALLLITLVVTMIQLAAQKKLVNYDL